VKRIKDLKTYSMLPIGGGNFFKGDVVKSLSPIPKQKVCVGSHELNMSSTSERSQRSTMRRTS
jgi:hypothetical protein